MVNKAKAATRRLSEEMVQDKNVQHFLNAPWQEWFLACAELCISKAALADGAGYWEEPCHLDGGASVLHMGMTLYGRRDLRLEQGTGLVRRVSGQGVGFQAGRGSTPCAPGMFVCWNHRKDAPM